VEQDKGRLGVYSGWRFRSLMDKAVGSGVPDELCRLIGARLRYPGVKRRPFRSRPKVSNRVTVLNRTIGTRRQHLP
jgi:hypothetical protein